MGELAERIERGLVEIFDVAQQKGMRLWGSKEWAHYFAPRIEAALRAAAAWRPAMSDFTVPDEAVEAIAQKLRKYLGGVGIRAPGVDWAYLAGQVVTAAWRPIVRAWIEQLSDEQIEQFEAIMARWQTRREDEFYCDGWRSVLKELVVDVNYVHREIIEGLKKDD